jgi:hypothetical protein
MEIIIKESKLENKKEIEEGKNFIKEIIKICKNNLKKKTIYINDTSIQPKEFQQRFERIQELKKFMNDFEINNNNYNNNKINYSLFENILILKSKSLDWNIKDDISLFLGFFKYGLNNWDKINNSKISLILENKNSKNYSNHLEIEKRFFLLLDLIHDYFNNENENNFDEFNKNYEKNKNHEKNKNYEKNLKNNELSFNEIKNISKNSLKNIFDLFIKFKNISDDDKISNDEILKNIKPILLQIGIIIIFFYYFITNRFYYFF